MVSARIRENGVEISAFNGQKYCNFPELWTNFFVRLI